MKGKVDVDSILTSFGRPGGYQVFVYILLCLNYFPVSFNHVAMALYKFVPAQYKCKLNDEEITSSNETNIVISYEKCHILSTNLTAAGNFTEILPCQSGFEYMWDDRHEETIATEWDLICEYKHLSAQATSIYFAGVMLGGLVFGTISDKVGRKPVLLTTLYLHIAVGVLIYFLKSFIAFLLLRFIQGFLLQGLQSVSFVMMLEMFVPQHRSYVGVIIECFWSLGVMLLALSGYLLREWRYIQLAITLPSLLTISYLWLVPESVRWLIASNKISRSEKVVQWILKKNRINEEITWNYINQNDNNDGTKYSVLDMIKTPTLRKHSFIMFYIWWCCALVYYGLTLGTSNLAGNRYLNLFLSGLVEMPAYLASIYILAKFGRRLPLVIYFILSGIGCILSAVLPGETSRLVLALVGKFGVSGCLSIIFLYATELFPTLIRNVGFGACAFWMRVGALLAPQINSLLNTDVFISGNDYDIKISVPIIVFGCTSLLGALLTLALPETLGKKLPDTVSEAEQLGFQQKSEEEEMDGEVTRL